MIVVFIVGYNVFVRSEGIVEQYLTTIPVTVNRSFAMRSLASFLGCAVSCEIFNVVVHLGCEVSSLDM